ncbi:MAG: hypothetical protein ACE5ID_10400 [Acidobacteriota bacterium]
MGKELKSAYELVLDRLALKDAAAPGKGGAPLKLTLAQKKKIAAIRKEYEAKLAERRILFEAERLKTADPQELLRLETDYRRDREHLQSSRDARIRKVKKR